MRYKVTKFILMASRYAVVIFVAAGMYVSAGAQSAVNYAQAGDASAQSVHAADSSLNSSYDSGLIQISGF